MSDTFVNKPRTYFIDIDGCLLWHHSTDKDKNAGNLTDQLVNKPKLLPGVLEFFHDLDLHCDKIILTTGRRESTRKETEEQLRLLGLFWDVLIMGLCNGPRILINDKKPNGQHTAFSVNLVRNAGVVGLNNAITQAVTQGELDVQN